MELNDYKVTPAEPTPPVEQPSAVPNVFSPDMAKAESNSAGIDLATKKADDIVGEVFGQAVLHTLSTDEEVQQQMLDTAKQVVQDRASTIADKASQESTAQHFLKYEDACSYFGYDEKTTSKFHVNAMAAIMFIINTIYVFTIGLVIVAPVSFILSKLRVVIKKTWVAVILAFVIYFVIALSPVIVAKITQLLGGAA